MSRDGKNPDCTDRNLWLGLYQDFSDRREVSNNAIFGDQH
jgi:hypothetical protein